MSAKPRFGEKVLYKVPKNMKLGKSEAKWHYGVWLGSILTSDEHMIGTPLGVVKARSVTTLSEDERFDAKALEEMRGTPWKPSTRHKGSRIRTHIDDGEDDEPDVYEEDAEEYKFQVDDELDDEEAIRDIEKVQDTMSSRIGQSYGFYIKAN